MAIVIHKQAGLSGGWQTVKTTQVKNLGWLFRHASQVTELHFKKQSEGYLLKAIINCGEKIFETTFADKTVFCEVFNRNRTLRGVVCFFDDDQWQAVGELGYKRFGLVWSPAGQPIGQVYARDRRHAIRQSPKPYNRYKGEIYAWGMF